MSYTAVITLNDESWTALAPAGRNVFVQTLAHQYSVFRIGTSDPTEEEVGVLMHPEQLSEMQFTVDGENDVVYGKSLAGTVTLVCLISGADPGEG